VEHGARPVRLARMTELEQANEKIQKLEDEIRLQRKAKTTGCTCLTRAGVLCGRCAEEKNTINAPKICELFTAEELEPLKNFTCADHHKTLHDLLKEGARRLRQV